MELEPPNVKLFIFDALNNIVFVDSNNVEIGGDVVDCVFVRLKDIDIFLVNIFKNNWKVGEISMTAAITEEDSRRGRGIIDSL